MLYTHNLARGTYMYNVHVSSFGYGALLIVIIIIV